MGAKLIAYECVAPEHEPSLLYPDKLTINEGQWAFCPFDARATGHVWRESAGAEFSELLIRAGLIGHIGTLHHKTEMSAGSS
jgi:hypothetical protein